jgi:hypothetical protein
MQNSLRDQMRRHKPDNSRGDVSTGFEDEGYLTPMLILFCADDIDSKFLIDPHGDALLFYFPHVCQYRTLYSV